MASKIRLDGSSSGAAAGGSGVRNLLVALGLALASVGCATTVRPLPADATAAARVRLGEFQTVDIQPIELPTGLARNSANLKAKSKIQEHLLPKLRMVFPALAVDAATAAATGRVLRIEPAISEIKFIGGGARFMVGAMAGSSMVRMKVTFRDAQSGDVVASPEFQRVANAFAGSMTIGMTDNQMLEEIATDVANYAMLNR